MKPLHCIYLDQGPISDLRKNRPESGILRPILSKFKQCAFVFSDTHVEEITLSGRPLEFIEALEDIEAYYLTPVLNLPKIEVRSSLLKSNSVREAIPERPDFFLRTRFAVQDLLRLPAALHIAGSILDIRNVQVELQNSIDEWFGEYRQEMTLLCDDEIDSSIFIKPLAKQVNETKANLASLDTQQLMSEVTYFQKDFDEHRPGSQAELNRIPDDKIAEYLLTLLPNTEQVRSHYPKGFGKPQIGTGEIAGFAFLLFSLGVSSLKRPKKGGAENYLKRYISQYRDCMHIENASRCHVFITKDSGAAKLARATYAYAGIPTEVRRLQYND